MDESQALLLAIEANLRKQVQQGWLSICDIDQILKATGKVPDPAAYQTIRLLHCINFSEMPKQLRDELPALLGKVFGGEPMNLWPNEVAPASEPGTGLVAKKRGWFG